MFRSLSFVLAAIVATPLLAQGPVEARLTVDGEAYNVPLGKAFAIRINGERVTLRIDPQDDRAFDEAGVSFRFPASLSPSEEQASEGVTVWTIQGPNAAIMLQRYEGGLDPTSLLEVLTSNLVGEDDPQGKSRAVKLTGPERAYRGVQVALSTPAAEGRPATKSVQNVFTFANEGGVFALMLQDVHAADAEPSEEYEEALRLLGDSLKTGDEPAPPQDEAADTEASPEPPAE